MWWIFSQKPQNKDSIMITDCAVKMENECNKKEGSTILTTTDKTETTDSSSRSSSIVSTGTCIEMNYVDSGGSALMMLQEQHPDTSIGRLEKDRDNNNNKKRVQFSTITIHEHGRRIGDNPSVKRGVPLTLEWDNLNEFVMPIDTYESIRPSEKRLSKQELELNATDRHELMISVGYSRNEIRQAIKEMNIIKYKRLRTLETKSLHRLQALLQHLERAIVNATIRRTMKQKERNMIQYWLQQDQLKRTTKTTTLDHKKQQLQQKMSTVSCSSSSSSSVIVAAVGIPGGSDCDNNDDNNNNKCQICRNNPAQAMMMPCSHCNLCLHCAKLQQQAYLVAPGSTMNCPTDGCNHQVQRIILLDSSNPPIGGVVDQL